MGFDASDPKNLQLPPEVVQANSEAHARKAAKGGKRKRADHSKRFFGCSEEWFNAVFPVAGGKLELAVAIYLYHLHAINQGRPFALSNVKLAARLGVSRDTKYRTIKKLGDAKLLSVSRNGKASPVITLKVA